MSTEVKTTTESQHDAKLFVMRRLLSLDRYDMSVDGCSCCGSWVEKEKSEDGDWVR